jgi:mediator of RNA polymerase II transcription subunit 6
MAVDEPLDEVQWRAPELIHMFGGLRSDNVLEYFSQSPFYDRSSNNQVLKMQTQFNENLQGRRDLYSELKNMKGIEFVVHLAQEPDLWIIRKQNRLSPDEVRLLATYFVVRENIYMAPNIHSIVKSRLLSTSLTLSKALEKAASLPTYSPSQGYTYATDISQTLVNEDTSNAPTPAQAKPRKAASPASGNTPGPLNNININIPIAAVMDDKMLEHAMDRAFTFTLQNSSVYLDSPETVSSNTAISLTSQMSPELKTVKPTQGSPQQQKRRRKSQK